MLRQLSSSIVGLTLLLVLLSAGPAVAQTAINQSKANNGLGGCDAPGFPVTICKSGSYKLTGNLTVPNADTTAIEITASHVTLDLNGFAILGPTDCSGGLEPCAGDGGGRGITTRTVQFNITIRNGTIQGMGSDGILLSGDSHLVEYVHVRSNGNHGILIFSSNDLGGSIAQNNTVQRNGGFGIFMHRGSVRHNVVNVNVFGIGLDRGSASYNFVSRNVHDGLALSIIASYFGNALIANTLNVAGGLNLGQNLCDTVVCPGAQH